MMPPSLLGSVPMLAALALSLQVQAPPLATAPQATRLEYRVSPIVDLHFFISAVAAERSPRAAGSGDAAGAAAAKIDLGALDAALVDAAIEALRPVQALPGFDANFAGLNTAAEVAEDFAGFPENLRMRSGESMPARERALAYARALHALEPAFLRDRWPVHRERIEVARRELDSLLGPREAACLAFMIESLGMREPRITIPVYLTATAPYPGGSTARQHAGGGVCFVSVDDLTGSLLAESVLHEATHALDLATADQPTVFNQMRRQLDAAGILPRDGRHRDAWHTIMFLQAGETVRRIVNARHEHYGDARGYYPKVPEVIAIERPIWLQRLDGIITQEQAVDRIVEGIARPRPQ